MTNKISDRKPLPPLDVLHKFYIYSPQTGELRHRKTRTGCRGGELVGALVPHGYRLTTLLRVRYKVHRIIFAMIHGVDPGRFEVDHIDGNCQNNKPENLRLADRNQNKVNGPAYRHNPTGMRGVAFHRQSGKYQARISWQKKRVRLGCYDNAEDAARAYDNAAKRLFGEFARPNFPQERRA